MTNSFNANCLVCIATVACEASVNVNTPFALVEALLSKQHGCSRARKLIEVNMLHEAPQHKLKSSSSITGGLCTRTTTVHIVTAADTTTRQDVAWHYCIACKRIHYELAMRILIDAIIVTECYATVGRKSARVYTPKKTKAQHVRNTYSSWHAPSNRAFSYMLYCYCDKLQPITWCRFPWCKAKVSLYVCKWHARDISAVSEWWYMRTSLHWTHTNYTVVKSLYVYT
jgi:hypothetical protein